MTPTPSRARYSDFHPAPFNTHRGDVRVSFGAALKAVKVKNPNAPAVKREAEEDWGR
jgi:hypothetical protein